MQAKVESSENDNIMAAECANKNVLPISQQNVDVEQKLENHTTESTKEQIVAPTMTSEATKAEDVTGKSKSNDGEQRKNGENAAQTTQNKDAKQTEGPQDRKMEMDGGRSSTPSPKTQRKTKKTKKKEQQPVSEQAIPLPPPPPTESAK